MALASLVIGAFLIGRTMRPSSSSWPAVVSVAGFQLLDATPAMTGIEVALENAIRNRLREGLGANDVRSKPRDFVLTGTLTPSADGAQFHAALIRVSDGETIWRGVYNPFCEDSVADPVPLIGTLVARSVITEVAGPT